MISRGKNRGPTRAVLMRRKRIWAREAGGSFANCGSGGGEKLMYSARRKISKKALKTTAEGRPRGRSEMGGYTLYRPFSGQNPSFKEVGGNRGCPDGKVDRDDEGGMRKNLLWRRFTKRPFFKGIGTYRKPPTPRRESTAF